jgi:tripartite motif-containing protein 71
VSDRFRYLEIDDGRVPRASARRLAPGSRPDEGGGPPPGQEACPDVHGAPSPEHQPAGRLSREIECQSPLFAAIEVIGGPGTAIGEFQSPGGIAVDRLGNLYVADSYNHRVQRITPAGDVAATGERGTRPGQFLNPQGITVDEELRFYVVEQGSHRLQAFTPHGEYLGAWGGPGAGLDGLHSPMGIAIGPGGILFVADTGNGRVLRLSRDAVLAGGRRRAQPYVLEHDSFRRPQGVAVDRRGRLYVADAFRHQVLCFDAALRFQGAIGEPGEGPRQLGEPQDLAVDDRERLFVVECSNHRLQMLSAGGEALQCLASLGRLGQLAAPSGVAVAPDGSIYVADTGHHRIVRLKEIS